jgi:NAD(P)-dependent dehydrogenase (short-subunit alcohol dehydrogenase family)
LTTSTTDSNGEVLIEFRLDGKVALVTGAGPNNGHAIARALSEAGADVAVSDLNVANSEEGARLVAETGRRALSVPFDITDLDAVQAGVERVRTELGSIDVLVNNAGTIEPRDGKSGGQLGLFLDSDPAIWHRWIDLNIYGSLHCVYAVLAGMVERGWGRVIQISSGAAHQGLPSGHSMYGAGKAGIEAAIRHIAIENATSGVTMNSIAVGAMRAKGAVAASNPAIEKVRASVPLGRVATSEDVAGAVQWLASEAGAFMTAQTIHLNGGVYSR